MNIPVYALLCFVACIPVTNASTKALEDMFERMTTDTLIFVKYLESLLLTQDTRCSAIQECSEANYDSCVSEFPFMECPGKDFSNPIHADECGSGKKGGCGAFFDFTMSKVSLAPSIRTPLGLEEDHVKDTVCWTLSAEQEMIRLFNSGKDYWDAYSVSPPVLFFGADNGVFRQYPAAGDKACDDEGYSSYDPRERPWYVAGSSGPKDIILVLDMSGSMDQELRIDKLKLAASRVISTLGIGDYFAVVSFSDKATELGTQDLRLSRATDDNKNAMLDYIDRLVPDGATNYYSGFEKAFDIFEESNAVEVSTSCRQAILFVTDGIMGDDDSVLYDKIDLERNKYVFKDKQPPAIFTYSFGDSAPETVPKELACRYDGVWSRISDEENLADSMGAYYKYFSYGLGDERNEDFVAWVSPYVFANGGSLGTTVSAPVYDRSVEPPVLAGVVGFDFTLAAMERALGKESAKSRDIVIEDIVRKSIARCPIFQLTACQLESLRMYGTDSSGFNEATCQSCSSGIPFLESAPCSTADLSNIGLWNNANFRQLSFEERLCCNVGESRAAGTLSLSEIGDQTCREDTTSSALIYRLAGALAAGVIAICAGLVVCKRKKKRKMMHEKADDVFPSAPNLPPPIAPPASSTGGGK